MDTGLLTGELDFSRYNLLTDGEKQLLQTLIAGRDANGNKGLAHECNVTPQTVRNEFSSIFRKLGVRNRFQAATFELLRPKPTAGIRPEPLGEFQDVYVATSAEQPSSNVIA
jgi:DNA-binding CsgD family transcriptional regulator